MEIIVTGHSKGGALAPALALWLHDSRLAFDTSAGWDASQQSKVACVTFAGPTPGNRAFANRIDRDLGPVHQRVANTNDLVTHAWETTELRQIPSLFERPTAPLDRLIRTIADATSHLDYQHASTGVVTFAGTTDSTRSLGEELIFQHMDAYLERFGLRERGIDALTLFLG